MQLAEQFASAQVRVRSLARTPDAATLLELYGLFKQATLGDVQGTRPGALDLKGRAKWEAWAHLRGLDQEAAMARYVALVDRLLGAATAT
jgi:diazepam-binding inhibitor (GABA receptor modulating acyl-CoA-binding protein)